MLPMFLGLMLVAAPQPPAELPGTLVIVGGGGMPENVRAKFLEAAGGAKARIVVIPTASAAADDPKETGSFVESWKKLTPGPASVELLHTRDRTTADTEAFCKPLTEATAVWFSGGDQSKITAAYRGTKTAAAIDAVFQRGGVVGGTSAGAAIMSDPMIAGGKTTATLAPGLGYLPGFVTDQHFLARKREERLNHALTLEPGRVGLGIDEGTAAIVRGRTLKVLGESTVTVVLPAGGGRPAERLTLKSGATADLFQLRRAAANRAAMNSFPPKSVAKAEVAKGSLVIVGGGGAGPEIWKRFIELAGGPEARIVMIPTSAEDPSPETPVEV
ncbi:MAG: cyanophycinase, partial [Gemmataceae bacterium]